jgi:hypothetical protein
MGNLEKKGRQQKEKIDNGKCVLLTKSVVEIIN